MKVYIILKKYYGDEIMMQNMYRIQFFQYFHFTLLLLCLLLPIFKGTILHPFSVFVFFALFWHFQAPQWTFAKLFNLKTL